MIVRNIIVIIGVLIVAIVVFNALSGCAGRRGSSEQQLYTALDVIGSSVDSTSELAASSCKTREQAEVAQVKAGDSTTARAEQNLRTIRSRCDSLRRVFDQLRQSHSEAVQAVQAGALDRAQQILEEIKRLWHQASEEQV